MKVRVTLMTENNVPIEKLGPNPEAKIKEAWEFIMTVMNADAIANSENGDRGYVESVEIVED